MNINTGMDEVSSSDEDLPEYRNSPPSPGAEGVVGVSRYMYGQGPVFTNSPPEYLHSEPSPVHQVPPSPQFNGLLCDDYMQSEYANTHWKPPYFSDPRSMLEQTVPETPSPPYVELQYDSSSSDLFSENDSPPHPVPDSMAFDEPQALTFSRFSEAANSPQISSSRIDLSDFFTEVESRNQPSIFCECLKQEESSQSFSKDSTIDLSASSAFRGSYVFASEIDDKGQVYKETKKEEEAIVTIDFLPCLKCNKVREDLQTLFRQQYDAGMPSKTPTNDSEDESDYSASPK